MINLQGRVFPLPRRLREQIFYNKIQIQKDGKTTTKLVQSALSRMVVESERMRDMENFTRQCRQSAEAYPDLPLSLSLQSLCDSSAQLLSDRESIAQKNLLTNLRKEKV